MRSTVDFPSPERPHSTRQRPGATDSDTSRTPSPGADGEAGTADASFASRSDSST